MLVRSKVAWVCLATCASAFGCDVEPGDRASAAAQPIVGGMVDTQHRSVVAVTSPQNPYPSFCTATVITPRVLITAAHCVVDAKNHHADVFAFFGDAIGDGGVSIPVIELAAHPDFDLAQSNSANDIGLLRLASDAPVPPVALGGAPVEGVDATLVGFGYDTPDETGMGTRRAHAETIGHVAPGEFSMAMSGSCDGDSGGPILVDGPHAPMIVGIHSAGDCHDISFEARFDPVLESFVLPFVDSGAICDADGACALGCAAPDPDCPCIGDGQCTAACADVASDPDCDPACGADGTCATDCPLPDPDCDDGAGGTHAGGAGPHDAADEAGGCTVAPSRPTPANLPAIVAMVGSIAAAINRGRSRRPRE